MTTADLSKQARGRWGEDRAAAHLVGLGYSIVDRNWRSGEKAVRGELDIVARVDDLVVICEVKARRGAGFGGAAAAVNHEKQDRIRVLGEAWIRENAIDVDVRFDVITIEGVELVHYQSAF